MTTYRSRPLAELTTMKVGGTPTRMVAPADRTSLVDTAREVWETGDEWLLLGGGSNTVASDRPFEGTVIRVCTWGIEQLPIDEGKHAASSAEPHRVRLRVQAGETWDALVAHTVRRGWAGIEALSGIPGSVGAAPVQNIGAYGQELSSCLVNVEFLDYESGEIRTLTVDELGLGYRTSVLKRGLAGVVLSVTLDLLESPHLGAAFGAPIAYDQLAHALGVKVGARLPLAEVRRAVLALRASKGMVLDAKDPDSVSAGSFFTNPIVGASFASSLPKDAPRWPVEPEEPDLVAALNGEDAEHSSTIMELARAAQDRARRMASTDNRVKLSAAWLIEHAGIRKGFGLPGSRAAISSKHTLAITNRGGAKADEIAQLARYVQQRVQAEFGVLLQPEPVLVGLSL